MRHFLAIALLSAHVLIAADRTQGPKRDQWSVVGGGPEGMRYSALRQINRSNVKDLQKVWQFDSGDEYEGSEIQCNPIIVDGVMYAATPRLRVIALDAATGKLLWDFDARRGERSERQAAQSRTHVLDRRNGPPAVLWTWAMAVCARRPIRPTCEGVRYESGRIDLREGSAAIQTRLTVQANSPWRRVPGHADSGDADVRGPAVRPRPHSRI